MYYLVSKMYIGGNKAKFLEQKTIFYTNKNKKVPIKQFVKCKF